MLNWHFRKIRRNISNFRSEYRKRINHSVFAPYQNNTVEIRTRRLRRHASSSDWLESRAATEFSKIHLNSAKNSISVRSQRNALLHWMVTGPIDLTCGKFGELSKGIETVMTALPHHKSSVCNCYCSSKPDQQSTARPRIHGTRVIVLWSVLRLIVWCCYFIWDSSFLILYEFFIFLFLPVWFLSM